MDRSLNIAHCVESYAPSMGGMVEVVRQLSERMVRMGHQVTVFTSAHPARTASKLNGVNIRSFHISGNAVDGITGEVDEYVDALIDPAFDVVTFFAAQQWATDAALPQLARISARKVFVPTGFSALHRTEWADHYAKMPERMALMDVNVFHSEGYQDVRFAKQHGITKTTLIPNGAAEEEFDGPAATDFRAANGIGKDRSMLVHVGSFTGIKGQREALEIFAKASTGDAVLVLIGNGNKALQRAFRRHWRFFLLHISIKLQGKRVLFLELDRATTVDALKQADLFIFPSKLECSPIVLFEAMAAGIPFLASEAGNSAELAAWSQGGWIIPSRRTAPPIVDPDVARGAELLGRLLKDKINLHTRGISGKRAWKEKFTWRHITQQYLQVYQGHHA